MTNIIAEIGEDLNSAVNETEKIDKKAIALMFLDEYKSLTDEGKSLINPFLATIKGYRKDVSIYFNNADSNQILSDLKYLREHPSKNDIHAYFNCFVSNKKGDIEKQLIKSILDDHLLSISFILKNKKLVDSLHVFFHDYLLANPRELELFISMNDVERKDTVNYNFPKFTDKEINKWIMDYLSLGHCDDGYLHCLSIHKDGAGYTVYPKTIVAIKERLNQIEEDNSSFICIPEQPRCDKIVFDLEQVEPVKVEQKENEGSIIFSGKWILENRDYPTLLNNLIYLFEFVDNQFRIYYAYNPNNDGCLIGLTGIKHKSEYGSEAFFDQERMRQDLFNAYVNFLRGAAKINIEDIFSWYFSTYLRDTFRINEMTLGLAPVGNDIVSRCKTIFVQIERAFKQYLVYVDNSMFSERLFEATRGCYKFSQYKTLMKDKYFIINEKFSMPDALFVLLDCSKGLGNIDDEKNKSNLASLLLSYNLSKSDLTNYQQCFIDPLLSEGFLVEDSNGVLRFPIDGFVRVGEQLFTIGFLSRNHLNETERKAAEWLLQKGFIQSYSALLSPQEADYFSFYLNNEKFSNAAHLRNGYEHPEFDTKDVSFHEQNYLIGLRIMALAIIKINDDLWQKKDEEENKFVGK